MSVTPAIQIELVTTPPDVAALSAAAQGPESGAVCLFVGTVRNATQGRAVVRLEFEAYESMALKELRKIAENALHHWPLHRIVIQHYVGIAPVGTVVVVIAVSSTHRAAGFSACQYCIDTLKESVPIWKKEIFEDGAVWVSATP